MGNTKTLKQKVIFDCAPQEFYDAFMDPKKHAEFTGGKATISQKVGGKFSVWDGYASGENLELVPGKKIVQTWRASDWPEGLYSKITLELENQKDKTLLKFTHEGIPAENFEEIKQGWIDYYWTPMKKMVER